MKLAMDWSQNAQFFSVGDDKFDHPTYIALSPNHDLAHLICASSGLKWKPAGTRPEVCFAEFNAVLLENLTVHALANARIEMRRDSIPDVLTHLRWFVQEHYAPFPVDFQDALAAFRADIEPNAAVRLSPLSFRVQAYEDKVKDHAKKRVAFEVDSDTDPADGDWFSTVPKEEFRRLLGLVLHGNISGSWVKKDTEEHAGNLDWDSDRVFVVASCENKPYLAWQAKLLAYSAVERLGLQPERVVLVVHDTTEGSEGLAIGFREAESVGCRVIRESNFRGPRDYACRNKPASLLTAARELGGEADFLLLIDPDEVFVRRFDVPARLGGQFYNYMGANAFEKRFERLGWNRWKLFQGNLKNLMVGTPHLIPGNLAADLAKRWIAVLDRLSRPNPGKDQDRGREFAWDDDMYAFGIACLEMGELPVPFDKHQVNAIRGEALRDETGLIHYCYGGNGDWNKRTYMTEEGAAKQVWAPPTAEPGSVHEEVFRQLRDADRWYNEKLWTCRLLPPVTRLLR